MGGRLRAGGVHCWLRRRRNRCRLSRQEKRSRAVRHLFRSVFRRNHVRRESPSICFLAADRRRRHRCSLSNFSQLHCRNCPHPGPRPLCHALPAWNRGRHSRRRIRQHAHSAHGRRSVEHNHGLALDVFRRSRTRDSFRIDDSARGRKPALAHESRPPR